jgi:serine kinase of HPr protein (carbohydrate metabolism regulator)
MIVLLGQNKNDNRGKKDMKLKKIADELNLELVSGYYDENREVDGAYIGDLLSIVMSKAKENNIWITIQTHLNVVAVASLIGISCIIIAENMKIDHDTIEKADEVEIPIFRSSLNSYELACKLKELGV